MTQDEYISYDGSGLAQLIRAKEVKASELLDLHSNEFRSSILRSMQS